MKYRPEIDGLRAVAVLAVFLFHLGVGGFAGGFVGVDVFFVISGYLITSIIQKDLEKDSFSIVKFYDRRFRRIMPALYFVLIPVSIFTWLFFMPLEMKNYCKSLLSTLLFYSNFHFWSEAGYFDMDSEMKPLLHTWSLSIEEQFYIFFPTALYLIHRYWKQYKKVILFIVLLGSLLGNIYLSYRNPNAAFYFTPGRSWELLLGSLLALNAFPKIKNRLLNEIFGWAGMIMVLISVFLFSEETRFPGFSAMLPCFGTTLIVYATQGSSLISVGKVLSTAIMTGIGKISYSLYLWHWPAIVFTKYYLARDLQVLDQIVICLLATAGAYFSWKYIEQPFRTKEGFYKDGRKLFGYLVGSTALLCVFSYVGGYVKPGYAIRLSKDIRSYAKGSSDMNPDRKHCHTMSLEKIKNHELCEMGEKKATPDFIVWGDSYADAMMPGIKEEAKKRNVYGLFASSSGCSTLLGVRRIVRKEDLKCNEFNTGLIDTIKKFKIKNAILISAWGVSGYSTVTEVENLPAYPHITSDDYSQKNIQNYIYGFLNMLQVLEGMGVRVWIVDKVPKPDFNVPSYLGRYVLLGKDMSDLKVNYDDFLKDREVVTKIIEELRKSYSFEVIDVSKVLCAETGCDVEKDKKSLYYDHSHLSATGSKYVMSAFDLFFESLNSKK